MKMEFRFRNTRRLLVAACVAGAAVIGMADERILYKSVLPSGAVVYGDAPVANARRVDRIAVERHPPNPKDAEAAQRALAMTRSQLLRDTDAREARVRQLGKQIEQSYESLKEAELKLEQGREVQEGDRQGRRLLPLYYQRREALAGAVRQERQRLDRLVGERAALLN